VLEEGATACCYARSEKSWITDPAGVPWEVFRTFGDSAVYGDGAEASGGRLAATPTGMAVAKACCAPTTPEAKGRGSLLRVTWSASRARGFGQPGAAAGTLQPRPAAVAAEALGTALLLAIVVGSGIMGERLAGGNPAVALLGNTLATGAGLVVLITVLGPALGSAPQPGRDPRLRAPPRDRRPRRRRLLSWRRRSGAILGTWLAHSMFAEPFCSLGQAPGRARAGVLGGGRDLRPDRDHPRLAALPARRHARHGRPLRHLGLLVHRLDLVREPGRYPGPLAQRHLRRHSAVVGPAFVAAQIVGAVAAGHLCRWLFRPEHPA
jgi:hypothetical protein